MQVDLGNVAPDRLRSAVRATLEQQTADMAAPSIGARPMKGRLPPLDRLKRGAASAAAGEDAQLARYFQGLLELGYLVASADGLAAEERQVLAELIEHATGSAVDQEALKLHFADLDDAVAMLGRRERMQRAAAEFEDFMAREEAMSFAALVAIADGAIAEPEIKALIDLGQVFGQSEGEVQAVLASIVASIKKALGS